MRTTIPTGTREVISTTTRVFTYTPNLTTFRATLLDLNGGNPVALTYHGTNVISDWDDETDNWTASNVISGDSPVYDARSDIDRDTVDFVSSDKLQIPYDTALNPETFSLVTYCKVEGGAGSYRSPVTSRSKAKGYFIYASSVNKWEFWTGNGLSGWNLLRGPDVVIDEWTFICARYDGSNMYLNVDGTDYGPLAATNFAVNADKPFSIGVGGNDGDAFYFNGKIDQVQLFDRYLQDAEVAMVRQAILERQKAG